MKTKTKRLIKSALRLGLAGAVLAALCLAGPVRAGKGPAPGHSSAFGKTLGQWQEVYQRWLFGETVGVEDKNGNMVVGDSIVLLPVPPTPGDGTPGTQDVTLNPGQAFVLPFCGLLGTSYNDGTPPDQLVDVSLFRTLDLTVKLDGATIIGGNEAMLYYAAFPFTPPIPISIGNMDAIIWGQSVGMVYGPLTPGRHTLTLDVANTQSVPPNFGGGFFEYHNTWHLMVHPGK